MKTDRKIIHELVNVSFEVDDCDFDFIVKSFEEIKKNNTQYFKFQLKTNIDRCGDYIEIHVCGSRYENDVEYKKRLDREEKLKKDKKELAKKRKSDEYQTFLKLKQKYEASN